MKCPKCGAPRPAGAVECEKCGIIFARIRPKREKAPQPQPGGKPSWTESLEVEPLSSGKPDPRTPEALYHQDGAGGEGGWKYRLEYAREFLLREDGPQDEITRYARLALLGGMALAAGKFMMTPIPRISETMTFLHLVNLPFHEAGHIIFTPFGRFLQVLGGSLAQLLVPLVCMGAFLVTKRDPFAAAVAWWWMGESLVDLSPYIYDARAGEMMLIGGITGRENPDFHDWKNLLTWTGLLKYDHALASLAFYGGGAVMISGLAWGWIVISRGGGEDAAAGP